MSSKVTVAIAADFLSCFAKIPRQEQARVAAFVNKFRADPTSPGINYEKIRNAKDPDLRSIRISDKYRGIIKKPKQGNVYLLLWVDNHDEAYAWAQNKKCRINPETGGIQVYDVWEEPEVEQEVPAKAVPQGLFTGISRRHLVKLGVPEDLVPLVITIRNEKELDEMAGKLPQEAYESLFFLASGYSMEEILESQALEQSKPVDVNDFETALATLDSQRRFAVLDDEELQAMLQAPLDKWRVFLHPSQRQLVERTWNGPVRVLGGAGTGKTVVAIHRAKYLAEKMFTAANDRILFTTFTRNLAVDIYDHLRQICSGDALERVEVTNLDRWVTGFFKQHDIEITLLFDGENSPYWEQALTYAPVELGLPDHFYREEWENVVQRQELKNVNEYLRASRVGRGTRVDRRARLKIWPVFEEYKLLLQKAGLREPVDAMRDARLLIENGQARPNYRAVIVDEAQDMSPQAMKLIRAIAGPERENDIFIVGDAHQRIYKHKVVLSQCGINIRGRSRKLRINYRTTEEIRQWAVGVLTGMAVDDLDGGLDDQKGYKSLLHGHPPVIKNFSSLDEEIKFILSYLNQLGEEKWKDICLVARTNRILEMYQQQLQSGGITVFPINPDGMDDRTVPGVRLATMHRIKGLEFDHIIIASANEGVLPLAYGDAQSQDPVIQEEHYNRERALLYVAATRAKKEVLITSYGQPSTLIMNEKAVQVK